MNTVERDDVAVIGLGQMGARYAERFLAAGLKVTVWNRTPERSAPLASAGATVAPSAAAAIDHAEIIVAALENASAFSDTFLTASVLDKLRPGQLIVDTSTVHPDSARAAASTLQQYGASYLDAPVSGGTRGAAQGTLTIMAGGERADFERARAMLSVLGTPHFLGPTGAGQIAKLANQTIVAVTIGAVAEGLFLAQHAGLDIAQLLSVLQGGFADSRILREHGDRMARCDFAPGAANRVFLKDLKAITALAQGVSANLPMTAQARRAYERLIAAGYGEQDHSSYFNFLALADNG